MKHRILIIALAIAVLSAFSSVPRANAEPLTIMAIVGVATVLSANPFYAGVQGHYWKVIPPSVPAVNPTGSGDAMVGGILYGFHQGWKFEQCLAFGAAAGAANARKWQVANSSLAEIMTLEPDVKLQRL